MLYYIDVLLPIPVKGTFTYKINSNEAIYLKEGMRVSVPFGKRKLYAGLVIKIHNTPPEIYEAKEIDGILDNQPIVLKSQLKLWEWMSNYYMCTNGELLKAALPSALLLKGETIISKTEDVADIDLSTLKDDEYLVYEALQFKSSLKIEELTKILGKKTVLPVAYRLLEKELVVLDEYIIEQYKPKLKKWVKLKDKITKDELPSILENLKNAPKQREVILKYFTLKATLPKVSKQELLEKSKATSATFNSLVKKEIFEVYTEKIDLIDYSNFQNTSLFELNLHQQNALKEIETVFETKDVCLLHGITSSGKTEVYNHLFKKIIDKKKQALLLIPEISITTQLVERLKIIFGNHLAVFHSKYSSNERVETYYKVLKSKDEPLLILGARSAIFLPFQNLELIVVDEEQETTFKQFDPAPRYHARDTAIVLAKILNAKVLLGSATPSIESFQNTKKGKYGLVSLKKRHKNIVLPAIELIDLQQKYRKKLMKGHFSDRLLECIEEALYLNEQIIIFQNRRGYASVQNCLTCGYVPQCTRCDVSLTYHKFSKKLRCHYCGYQIAEQTICRSCNSNKLSTKGLGTEQIETELKSLFPKAKVGRMDQDTTRGKYGHHKLISQFENMEIDILVGTQMIAKGLDFKNVNLVGVINAEEILNIPDFRSHERTFQLLSQVSGRAGRHQKQGKVLIQSYNPLHQILQQVSVNDYETMFKEQMQDRKNYFYPPFCKIIRLTVKHKDFNTVNEASDWIAKALKNALAPNVLGPEFPAVARIRNLYNKDILIKIPLTQNLKNTKEYINKMLKSFSSIKTYSNVRVILNVDVQ